MIAASFADDRNTEKGNDAGEMESALAGISSSVRVGRTALLAVVDEQSPDVIDTATSGL